MNTKIKKMMLFQFTNNIKIYIIIKGIENITLHTSYPGPVRRTVMFRGQPQNYVTLLNLVQRK